MVSLLFCLIFVVVVVVVVCLFVCNICYKNDVGYPQVLSAVGAINIRFPEITGEDNLTEFSYFGRVKSPEWRRQLRRADLRQF